ncbi:MAG: ion channel [Candidatus Pacearchaeota archaeon]|jgi:hypothetical protein
MKKHISRFNKIFFDRPILKLIYTFITLGIFFFISSNFSNITIVKSILNILLIPIILILGAYSVLLIAKIIFIYLIHRPFNQLFNAQNLTSLLLSYAIFIFGILFLISLTFMQIEHLGLGYITYGTCSDNFKPEMIANDQSISHNYFYFSAATFFTIGYGDICPMGLSQIFSILTAFIGNIVTVVLMAIVVTLYLNRKNPDNSG